VSVRAAKVVFYNGGRSYHKQSHQPQKMRIMMVVVDDDDDDDDNGKAV
jgi:hypothetical protein